ncbi:universal stress protein [Robiginitalea sp. SC105]|uniref:universal stress protein n=1 Tax=Robiginitalea sp. SC105 TaxID=2762332 RepID=UPI001639B969|nr:universal stress protein [Robiginitalea sp. SC105]MBC2838972.1 universal stress protein [Robiginitalea sp. SC105]
MERINDILVPYDFSPPTEEALRYALDFVGNREGKKVTLCFMQEKEDLKALETRFDTIKSGVSRAFRSTLEYIHFSPPSVPEFIRRAQALKTDLILMGTSGSQDPEGTTKTADTVLAAEIPVLVVPQGVDEEFKLRKIALILGQNEIDDPKDLATLLNFARMFNARVHVLTIQNTPGVYGYSREDEKNEDLLEYYLEDFYAQHSYIESEDVVQGIFDYAAEKEIDLLAVLPRNHVKKGTPSEGRLTRILSMQTRIPLLAIEH